MDSDNELWGVTQTDFRNIFEFSAVCNVVLCDKLILGKSKVGWTKEIENSFSGVFRWQ